MSAPTQENATPMEQLQQRKSQPTSAQQLNAQQFSSQYVYDKGTGQYAQINSLYPYLAQLQQQSQQQQPQYQPMQTVSAVPDGIPAYEPYVPPSINYAPSTPNMTKHWMNDMKGLRGDLQSQFAGLYGQADGSAK